MAKKPEYFLKKPVSYSEANSEPIEYGHGTGVFVFWNDHYVPKHIKDKLGKTPVDEVVCMIGQTWLLVKIANLHKR
jgi:hypothetical protein